MTLTMRTGSHRLATLAVETNILWRDLHRYAHHFELAAIWYLFSLL